MSIQNIFKGYLWDRILATAKQGSLAEEGVLVVINVDVGVEEQVNINIWGESSYRLNKKFRL